MDEETAQQENSTIQDGYHIKKKIKVDDPNAAVNLLGQTITNNMTIEPNKSTSNEIGKASETSTGRKIIEENPENFLDSYTNPIEPKSKSALQSLISK